MAVVVQQYDPQWPLQFSNIRRELEACLEDVEFISIEHVGSTSVPGLAAKPIIDIDIIVARETVQSALDTLTTKHEFDYLGELGIKDRHVLKDPNQTLRCNIYVCVQDAPSIRNHLALRDTLRSNPDLRDEYGRVKMELSAQGTNIVDYISAKSAIIQKILRASGQLTEEELTSITASNTQTEQFSALKTARLLLLREFVMNDEEAYFELESNEENARYQTWPPRTRKQARNLVIANIRDSLASPRTNFELAVEHNGQFIGRVGAKLSRSDSSTPAAAPPPPPEPIHFDLWYSFLPSHQGKGYATEAMGAFIQALKDRQSGREVEFEIECDPRNVGSWRVAERLGFTRVGLTERAYECKGEWVDSLVLRKVV